MPSPTYRSNAERWAADASTKMPGELILIGKRLIDQTELDTKHRDYRLRDILGRNWWANMIRMGSRNPGRTEQLWRHLIERRCMPPWIKKR
ncbi:hypothetical protein [Kushneria konosiri]|uniref:Uncharacterized protein n=1 Tax=Kushneria konosiri TaxID=698828 RepID=A0A2Z2HDZ8_9GAMM|nr:hypothetical protein [Kushneria konosiri]ARS51491.1 hypothetical protein B9G99_00070 [Kushneria konosiri]